MNAFRNRTARYLGLSASAEQHNLPGSSRSRRRNVPRLYAVFSALWGFLAVAGWLIYIHRQSTARLFSPIFFSAMAIAYLVLWVTERLKRQQTIGKAIRRPNRNTFDGGDTHPE
jgi:hypothetical protein